MSVTRRTLFLSRLWLFRFVSQSALRPGFRLISLLTVTIPACPLSVIAQPQDAQISFQSQVLPVLKRNCLKCHGVAKKEGNLQLHTILRVWKGGESGPSVVASHPSQSLLWTRVSQNEMPPENPLRDEDKKILHDWIAQGAPGLPTSEAEAQSMTQDEHWAFTRLKPDDPPSVRQPNACRTPIDQWVQAELERVGLSLGPETDRRTLIRRTSFTLTGLPPTPAEIDQFLADDSETAVETMIDRSLGSEQYGVRWGRHWLDAAGYADSNGYFNADSDRPLAYRYRDYVVRALNANKAFDQFVREQIAGDELSGFHPDKHRHAATPEMIDMLIATHYLRNGQDGSGESDGNPDEVRIDRYTALESAQQIVASSLLGLTFQCAKCHDHKFEPLTQADFYQFQSVLFPAYNHNDWVKPNDRFTYASLPSVYEAWKAQQAQSRDQLKMLKDQFGEWVRMNRPAEMVRFADDFSQPEQLSHRWTNTIPGDDGPAGVAAVTLLTAEEVSPQSLPAAKVADGQLKIVEGGVGGDKWLSTRQTFDWTPDEEGQWIQVTFALVDTKLRDGDPTADRIAYGIALHDFDNSSSAVGGNLLIDGNPDGGAAVHLDYPGPLSASLGKIGAAGYEAGQTFGIRITHMPERKFRLQHVLDGLPEGKTLDLKEQDLPDGSFGFGYCCGRSYQIDDVVVEASFSSSTNSQDPAVVQSYQAELKRRQEEISAAATELAKHRKEEPGRIAWLTDSTAAPPDVFLLDRGEYSQPKDKVEPAPIAVLNDDRNPMVVTAPASGLSSTGRRLAWANWVTRPGSRAASLMARVQVNRVWQHHFGSGIVSTSENLGMSGSDPTNPALLDWLAEEFIRSGWSLKSLHRLILRSAVFRQTSLANDAGMQVDPYNKLWWRYPIRRLDAEAVRDTLLAVSGDLDLTMEGPYVPTTRNGAAEVIVPENQPGAQRRSIYLQQRRSQGLSLLNVFDAPMMVINCTRRPVTTMPLQSLSLLNSEFAVKRGQSFANRVLREAGEQPESQIRLAFILSTGRPCSSEELSESLQFLQTQQQIYAASVSDKSSTDAMSPAQRALSDFCQLLLASNACLYVE